jgi:hypothetical protein
MDLPDTLLTRKGTIPDCACLSVCSTSVITFASTLLLKEEKSCQMDRPIANIITPKIAGLPHSQVLFF